MKTRFPMPSTVALDEILRRNLEAITARVAAAAQRAGRDASPGSITRVVVTKSVGLPIVERLHALGVTDLGENRIQDSAAKVAAVRGPRWHLIGHLQKNKVRRAVETFDVIHSIDSAELLDRVDRIAAEMGKSPRVLLQLNVSGEETKFGGDEAELDRMVDAAARCRAAQVVGLMTMAPLDREPEASRPWFRRLRELRDSLVASGRLGAAGAAFRELSMGMTNDFEVAVEEGATLLRVGRACFDGVADPAA